MTVPQKINFPTMAERVCLWFSDSRSLKLETQLVNATVLQR
jgi:hypothetical protein